MFNNIVRRIAPQVGAVLVASAFSAGALAQTLGTTPADMAGFKRVVAQRIMQVDKPKATKASVKGVSVVGYTLDRSGKLVDQWIVRSSGEDALDARAIATLKKAVPLPTPPASLFGTESAVHLSEAWVFTQDGSYQLQTMVSR